MENSQLKMIIEGALLAAGRSLPINQIEKLFDAELFASDSSNERPADLIIDSQRPSRADIYSVLEEIELSCKGRGFELKETAAGYRLQVRKELSPWINRLWEEKQKKYSRAFLETLSLIVYKQPVTRGEIEEIRGVSVSSDIIRSLLERDWVKVVGNKDVPGRPALYATTKFFLAYFNLSSLKELPVLKEIKEIRETHPEPNLGVVLKNNQNESDLSRNEPAFYDSGNTNQASKSIQDQKE
jgi:segregation and condensation protein B